MFLKTIEVQNFRSISTLKVEDLGQINIFTGENNCGKTTLLEAVFQLVGWHVGYLKMLISLRSESQYSTDFSSFFFNMNDDATIKITGGFDQENYHRTVKVHFEQSKSVFYEQNIKYVLSCLSESKKGKELHAAPIISKADTQNGMIPIEPHLQIPKVSLKGSFPTFKVLEHSNLVDHLSELIQNKNEQKVVALLNQIDNRIVGIRVLKTNIFLDLEGFPKLIPIEISGDGLRRILSVILAIYDVGKGGTVLIDEVENGLHFSTMPKFWRGIINAAQDIGVQLFITTHNEELLQSLSETAQEEPYKNIQSEIKYYNLKRYENDQIVAYKYDFEKFDYLISNGNEIR